MITIILALIIATVLGWKCGVMSKRILSMYCSKAIGQESFRIPALNFLADIGTCTTHVKPSDPADFIMATMPAQRRRKMCVSL